LSKFLKYFIYLCDELYLQELFTVLPKPGAMDKHILIAAEKKGGETT
jgi:hypothetical protein